MKRLSLMGLIFLLSVTAIFSKEQIKLGVIYGNESYEKYVNSILTEELERNFKGSEYEVSLVDTVFVSTSEDFYESLKKLESNSEIDAVMTMGIMLSELTLQNKEGYKKPVIAPLGVGEETKGIKNLSYINEPRDILGDIELIEELKEVKKISFLIPESYTKDSLNGQTTSVLDEVKKEGYEVEVILTSEKLDEVSKKLETSDVLYVFEGTMDNRKEVLDLAIENKVITFSRTSVGQGNGNVLISYDNKTELSRRLRASVISLKRVLAGDPQDEIVTSLGITEKIIDFNMEVARSLGIYPNLVFAQKVNFINTEDNDGEQLEFKSGVNMALDENTDLKSRKEKITRDEYNTKSAKAERRPELDAFAEYNRIDKDSARVSSTPAESSVRGGVSLSYLLYDENVNANVTVRDYQRMATESRYEQEGLDTIQSFSETYLIILEKNARLEVERYNYKLMREYLQIAQTKYEVGAAGPEDIYRFKSEIADALTNIAEVEGQIKVSEARLKRVLNRPMSSKYELEAVTMESPAFTEMTNILDSLGLGVEEARGYFVEEGIKNSPELKQLEYRILAKERELKAAERERYSPKVSAFGEWSDDLKDEWGEGSNISQDEDRWNIGARVEIPLYKGGDIEYSKQRLRSELRALEHEKEGLETEIGKIVSSAFSELVKGYIQTATAKDSARAASKNLELVGDFYAQGTISISDLLDARTNSISADQVEIAARYNYLRSITNLERSIGEYFVMMDDLEKGARLERVKSYLKSNGRR